MTVRRNRSELFRSKKFRRRNREESRLNAIRNLQVETLEERQLLASGLQLVSVQPNGDALLQDGDLRHVAPTELTFRFSGNQTIDTATLDGIQLTRAGSDGAFGDANEVAIQPGYAGLGETPNEVILRFSEALPDDLYQIDIFGSGGDALRNDAGEPFNDGVDQQLQFTLDLGPQVVAVVPQPITRGADGSLTQARGQIVVYFNNDELNETDAENEALYQLIYTGETANNFDDLSFPPDTATYDSDANTVTLEFADEFQNLPGASAGTFRLRIGTNESAPLPPLSVNPSGDVGSSFATAENLGTLGTQSQLVLAAIDAQEFQLDFPGANDEPGHRQIPEELYARVFAS